MRWIAILLLWIAAVVLAVVILRRVRRGKPIVLTGRWSPRLVRTIAIVLVVLGTNEKDGTREVGAAPAKLPIRESGDELPKAIQPYTVQLWIVEHQENGPLAQGRRAIVRALAGKKPTDGDAATAQGLVNRLPAKLMAIVQAELTAAVVGKPAPVATNAELLAALDEMEKAGRYDYFWNAYVWRKSAASTDPAGRVELFAHVRQHARVTDALIRAHAEVKPLMLPARAWMGKAGPPAGFIGGTYAVETALPDIVKVANDVLPTTDEGTWKRDGVTLLRPVAGSPAPRLVRTGKDRELAADESTRFGRLDLLRTGEQAAVVELDGLGKLDLPANRLVSVWELPDLLSDAAKQKLDATVHEALKSNAEEASDRLERCLAVSHQAIRTGLKELPNAKGAPRLRLILSLFDDTVMPALPMYRTAPEAGGGRGPGR